MENLNIFWRVFYKKSGVKPAAKTINNKKKFRPVQVGIVLY